MKKSIFITGAAMGIGKAVATLFATRGWHVGITDIYEPGLESLRKEYGDRIAFSAVMDVTDSDRVAAVIAEFSKMTGGKIDFLATIMKMVSIIRSFLRLNSPQRLARIMLNKTSMVSSVFDGRPSFQLSYRDYNTFFTNTMTDEVRKVNDRLFLGIGRLTITFGKYNPMPFVLMGPPDPWVGPDILFPE